jgi:hypothetical protein
MFHAFGLPVEMAAVSFGFGATGAGKPSDSVVVGARVLLVDTVYAK